MNKLEIRTVNVTQYIQPLREGGSLPAIVEADDGFMYVIKFRGSGQGTKALVAELIGAELARAIGLKVPEIVFMCLDDTFRQTEPDEEIQDLLKFSVGLNLGLHYLAGAITYDPLVSIADAETSSKVVLLDSIITNIDRTARNTNLLNWKDELWLIDHGASLYFHHNWANWESSMKRTFPKVADHVLLTRASQIEQASEEIKKKLHPEVIARIVNTIPEEWLSDPSTDLTPQEMKQAYSLFLNTRISFIDSLSQEAQDAR